MSDRIYVETNTGELRATDETPFVNEDELQHLVAANPELLGGEQIDGDEAKRWILIKREQPVSPDEDAAGWWSLDHLFVDQDAVLTLVECKRGSNTELRRKVVAQMLDYAAHSRFWKASDLRKEFESGHESEANAQEALARLLAKSPDEIDIGEVDEFWARVQTNLEARRIRLLFVADDIPDALVNIIKFLNEKMPDIDVLAVQIKRYKGELAPTTYVPHIIGQDGSAEHRGAGPTARLSRENLLASIPAGSERDAAAKLLSRAEAAGAYIDPQTRCVIIKDRDCPAWKNWLSLIWLNPPPSAAQGRGTGKNASFGAQKDPAHSPALRAVLDDWVDHIRNYEDAEEQGYQWADMFALTYGQLAEHIDEIVLKLEQVINELKALEPEPEPE